MIRSTTFIALVAACGLAAACQPAKTKEQIAAEQAAAAMQQMGAGLAAAFGAASGQPGAQMNPADAAAAGQAMGAIFGAAAAAGASGALNDPNMTAEDRAKLQAITGAMASGQTNPAVTAWLTGANKAFAILGQVKDVAGANAAKAQLMPIYAEMAGPAATLKAMTQDQRDVAMAASMGQVAAMSMNAMALMGPLSAKPEVQEAVGDLLDAMPQPE